ncbi:MAG: recombinase family protein [Pseudomonadota bacterium]
MRVSTQKQGEGVSLEAQKEAITAFASRENIEITRWFEEQETAAKVGRPIFTKIVQDLKRGKADGLICHKLDRLTRTLKEYSILGDLIDAGIDVHTAVDSLDFRSRGGRLTAEIQAVMAADYIRNLREETLKGMTGRLKQGLYPFRAPIGYLDTGRGQLKTPDPERAPLIKEAFELYASGQYSMKKLWPEMQRRGLTNRMGGKLSLHGLETILGNSFYVGVIHIKRTGATFPGAHEPLIAPALFGRVQDIKAGKCGPKVTKHNHTYRGLFRCGECGGPMVPERQKSWVYYRCPVKDCATKCVREEVIASAIDACLENSELTERSAKDAKVQIATWVREAKTKDQTRGLNLRRDNLVQRQHRLTDALVDGLISKAVFNERQKGLVLEEQALRAEAQAGADLAQKAAQVGSLIELTKTLVQSHQLADRAEKRRIVESTTSNRMVIGKKVYLEPRKWLVEVKNLPSTPGGDPSRSIDRTLSATPSGVLDLAKEIEPSKVRKHGFKKRDFNKAT